jgi:AraC family transcriptional regulator
MDDSQPVEILDREGFRGQMTDEMHAAHSSLAEVAGVLHAALRTWDADRPNAKLQVSIAAAMLRNCANELPNHRMSQSDLAPNGMCLAPWQERKVKQFIEESLSSRIRIQGCARKVRLSTNHFTRVFRATFGMTPSFYIRCRRIERSQHLMLRSHQPLSLIALDSGFSDQAHFCRIFRSLIGLSPKMWRRQHMKLAPGE